MYRIPSNTSSMICIRMSQDVGEQLNGSLSFSTGTFRFFSFKKKMLQTTSSFEFGKPQRNLKDKEQKESSTTENHDDVNSDRTEVDIKIDAEAIGELDNVSTPRANTISMEKVLSNSNLLSYLLQYTQRVKSLQYCNEILFCIEVEQYRNLNSSQRLASAKKIIDKYLLSSSSLMIGDLTNDTGREDLINKVQECQDDQTLEHDLFDNTLKNAQIHLSEKCYPGFTWSYEYNEMMKLYLQNDKITNAELIHHASLIDMLNDSTFTTLFLVYLSSKGHHFDLGLFLAIQYFLQNEYEDPSIAITYLYKSYLSKSSSIRSTLVLEDLSQQIGDLVLSLKNDETLKKAKEILSIIMTSLVHSLEVGFFPLFLESGLYKTAIRTYTCSKSWNVLTFLQDFQLPYGITLHRSQKPLLKSFHHMINKNESFTASCIWFYDIHIKENKEYYIHQKNGWMDNKDDNIEFTDIEDYLLPGGLIGLLDRDQISKVRAYNFNFHTLKESYNGVNLTFGTSSSKDKLYRNKKKLHGCCIVSTYPCLLSLRYKLEEVYKSIIKKLEDENVQEMNSNIFQELTNISWVDNSLTDVIDLPSIDFSFQYFLTCLDTDEVIQVFIAMLLEKKIIIKSSFYTVLTTVCETLKSIIYPLEWMHTYISVLPYTKLSVLHQKEPYLIGLNTELADEVDLHRLDAFVVDLDAGTVTGELDSIENLLPTHAIMELCYHINETLHKQLLESDTIHFFVGDFIQPKIFPTQCIRKSFFNFVRRMLKGYRRFCISLPTISTNESIVLFDTKSFLRSCGKDSFSFVQALILTKAFDHLIGLHHIKELDRKQTVLNGS